MTATTPSNIAKGKNGSVQGLSHTLKSKVRSRVRDIGVLRRAYQEVIYAAPYRVARFTHGKRRPLGKGITISFLPEKPVVYAAIRKVCLTYGMMVQKAPSHSSDVAILWHDTTFPEVPEELLSIAHNQKVLNIACSDISKRTLDEVHAAVFGYGLCVDPRTSSGPAVKKSNINARHDGKIVALPDPHPDPHAVYQRCVANEVDGDNVVDIRLPIFGETIPFVYLKYRPKASRFSNQNTRVEIVSTDTVISDGEHTKVIELCRRLGADYCEVDALRDRADGRLYVIDLNNTPSGPPNGLPSADTWRAIEMMFDAFHTAFIMPQVSRDPQ